MTIAETETPKKGPSFILQMAVFLLLTAAAVGGGWMTGRILNGDDAAARASAPAHEAEANKHDGSAEEPVETLRILPLATITTNLADPQDIWIRLEVALAFHDRPDAEIAELVHQDLLAYLRTVKARQIDGPSGFQQLRSDLDERARIRSGGKVKQVLIRTMLFE